MKKNKKYQMQTENGSAIIILIIFISILYTLCVGLVSHRITSACEEIFAVNSHKAQYLAESGIRYAEALDCQDNSYYTFVKKDDGSFVRYSDDPPPAVPHAAGQAGFRISVEDCRQITSIGIIGEGSPFEVARAMTSEMHFKGLPCWAFEEGEGNVFDYCSGHTGEEAGMPGRVCQGRYGKSIQFTGTEYVKTSFDPFCEIGDDQSFIVTFWAKPAIIDDKVAGGAIFGVQGQDENENTRRLTISAINEKWVMFFGNTTIEGPSVLTGWQHLFVQYDGFTGNLDLIRNNCVLEEKTSVNVKVMGGVQTLPKKPKNIYIGAEHGMSGQGDDTAFYRFSGEIDELTFHDPSTADIEKLKLSCSADHLTALYVFNDGLDIIVSDETGKFNGTRHYAVPAEGRYGCQDHAFSFNKTDQYIEGEDQMVSKFPFSVNIWASVAETDDEHVIFSLTDKDNINLQFGIYINDSGFSCLRAKNGAEEATTCQASDSKPINDGKWHLISAVFRSKSNRELFVDGVSVANSDEADPKDSVSYSSDIDRWSIGRWGNGSGYFSGVIDEVSVYEKPLTQDEIQAIFHEGNPY